MDEVDEMLQRIEEECQFDSIIAEATQQKQRFIMARQGRALLRAANSKKSLPF